ncbi:MAG: DUF4351 domain-containing protein [Magnetococcus sp. YQC-5]
MLAQSVQEWVKPWMDQARQEAAAAMLLSQMRRKFGQTPDWVTDKVKSANLEWIEAWLDNIVFANSVDEVFAS